jgi:hypothetical protein
MVSYSTVSLLAVGMTFFIIIIRKKTLGHIFVGFKQDAKGGIIIGML